MKKESFNWKDNESSGADFNDETITKCWENV